MYEFPVLWGIPQSFNEGAFFFAAVWAAMTVTGCVAFASAVVAQRKNRPSVETPRPNNTAGADEDLESAA